MNLPPLLMSIRIRDEKEKFRLYLPIPLILLLPIFVLLIPVLLIAAIVLCFKGWGLVGFKALWYVYNLFCAIRGTKIEVESPKETVKISIV